MSAKRDSGVNNKVKDLKDIFNMLAGEFALMKKK